jgi:hypothetical protein
MRNDQELFVIPLFPPLDLLQNLASAQFLARTLAPVAIVLTGTNATLSYNRPKNKSQGY